ncbi:diguanylate cyclase with PAS/PAC sensor [Thermodesulfobium narugense DSM 14796]|uniref:Diguanylate cyclase with PAS/PAC sensor n=1 Tax=Thermodesulfobium narugense DSM 14796 TaxID=747365 RepID=M1E6P0_9BACT|nr:diguanylate cyclase with PAS/PAC sensor [Thermodesulfobium narugense DSM 14796]
MKFIRNCNLRSLRCRLLIVIVVSFLVPFLFFLCTLFIEYQDLKNDISNALDSTAERYKSSLENFISSEFYKLEIISSLESIKNSSQDSETILRNLKGSFPEAQSVAYVNMSGQIIYSSNNLKNISIADRSYFINAMKGERALSGLLLSRISNEKIITFAVPVFSEKNFITGVIISEIPVETLYKLTAPINSSLTSNGYNIRFALLDQNSNVIVSFPGNSYQFTRNDYKSFLSNPINFFSLIFFDRWLCSEVKLADTNWSIYCAISSLSFLSLVRLAFFGILFSLFVLLVLLFLSYFFVYNELSRPLKVLEGVFNDIRKGVREINSINPERLTLEFGQLFYNIKNIWTQLDKKDSELEAANKELRSAERRYRALVDNSLTGIFMLAPDFTFRYANVQFASIFGYSIEELLVKSPLDLFTQDGQEAIRSVVTDEGTIKDDRFHSIITGVHKNGNLIYLEILLTYLLDDDGIYLFGTAADVSDKVAYQRNLEFLSYRDSLTGVYNRRFFEEELAKLSISRLKRKVAIVVVDIDCLKWANDRIGHAEGDNLIIRTARLLESIFKELGEVCRIGGDEFAVICIDYRNDELNNAIDKLKKSSGLAEDDHVPLYISFGVAFGHVPGDDMQEIFRRADDAMYMDKGSHHEAVYNVLKIYAKERGIES